MYDRAAASAISLLKVLFKLKSETYVAALMQFSSLSVTLCHVTLRHAASLDAASLYFNPVLEVSSV